MSQRLYVWKVKGFYPQTTIDFEEYYVAELASQVIKFLEKDSLECVSIEREQSITAVVPSE